MTTRNALIAIAVAFAVWETTNIPDARAFAAAFALLFVACSIWLWRRSSRIAALVLMLQFTIEATQAHTWRDASTTAQDTAMVLGSAGIAAALAFVVRSVWLARGSEQRTTSAARSASRLTRQHDTWS